MNREGFITYSEIVKVLEENHYHGFTAGRCGTRKYRTTFVSIRWYTIDIVVETLKIDGERIVIGIEFNGEKLENYECFKKRLRGIGKEHAATAKQKVR